MPCSRCHFNGHNRRTCPCIIEGVSRILRNANGDLIGQNDGYSYFRFKFEGNKYSYCKEDMKIRNPLGHHIGTWTNHSRGGFPLGRIEFNEGYEPLPAPPVINDPLPAPPVINDPLPAPPVINDPLPAPPVINDPPPVINDLPDGGALGGGDGALQEPAINITLRNMRNENYLIYWVLGNNLVMDLDACENEIKYFGILLAKSDFKIKTLNGHRFHLVPYPLTTNPPYHPPTDKTFFIQPYVSINIHPEINTNIHIDDGDKLSELNKWKFNALKLDYLMKELIKLGGMNYDSLEPILDLHQDIQLDDHDEYEKDRAGIPSVFTNVT